MSKVLGQCPKCGADYVDGYYGPYCTGKCGFRLRRVLGKDLTGDEITALLKGEKILLIDLTSRRTGNLYSMYVQPQEVEEYSFQNRNGEEVTGYRFKYIMTFPDWRSGSSTNANGASAGNHEDSGQDGSRSDDMKTDPSADRKTLDTYIGWDEELPFL